MRTLLLISIFISFLSACEVNKESVGTTQDKYGCLSSAGFSYSFLQKECVQPFKRANIRLADPVNHDSAIYVVLSEDKSQAELFSANLPQGTILEAVKGGYLSKDNQIRLIKRAEGWKIYL
ncbi:hypothetical protein OQ257_04595 [Actinobacillus equuli subsp. equuli]|uniref:Lipoprotein n=1 Tax=Actinobacillus equuli subsp. equuli TaxID=202947 RepID=A0A9X4G386_ACTEU|nr:hypothetical protein [Actinobacillus equuli]MDE8034442.1 hypothetical protein [Actinobacillus equuli subsp. equuli]MDG4947488.1 hypothetical protein [Actinobacillus equuli subsp. haemolyticus]